MLDLKNGFVNDFFSAIFTLTGRTFIKVSIAYVFTFISLMLSIVPLGFYIYKLATSGDIEFPMEFLQNPNDISILTPFFEELVPFLMSSSFLVLLFLFIGVVAISYSWLYNFTFLLLNNNVNDNHIKLVDAISLSLNKNIFKILSFVVLIALISILYFSILASIVGGTGSSIVGLVFTIFFFVIYVRFACVFPILLFEDESLISSIIKSFNMISFKRAVKIFGATVLGVLLFVVAMTIFGLVTGLLGSIPFIGPVITLTGNMIIGGFIVTFVSAISIGLYYRYSHFDSLNINELNEGDL